MSLSKGGLGWEICLPPAPSTSLVPEFRTSESSFNREPGRTTTATTSTRLPPAERMRDGHKRLLPPCLSFSSRRWKWQRLHIILGVYKHRGNTMISRYKPVSSTSAPRGVTICIMNRRQTWYTTSNPFNSRATCKWEHIQICHKSF